MYIKTFYLAALTATVSMVALAGKPPGCTDQYVNITVVDYSGSGISSDGGGTYSNGQNGVIARLNCDGDSVELSGTRPSYLDLGTVLDGKAPSWGSSAAPIAFFNVWFGGCFNNANPSICPQFTTWMSVTMAAPNLGNYFIDHNPSLTAGGLQSPESGVNSPCTSAQVQVTHYAAGTYPGTPAAALPVPGPPVASTGTGAPETWYIVPLSSTSTSCSTSSAPAPWYVGTLYSGQIKGSDVAGQYNVPFLFVVQRQ